MTDSQKNKAIELAIEGFTRKAIRREIQVTNGQLNRAEVEDPKFHDDFERAILVGVDSLADDLLSLDENDIQRARLISENVKWYLSKRKPSTYGDKIEVSVNKTINLGTALSEAKSRVRDVTHTETVTYDKHTALSNSQTDNESVGNAFIPSDTDIYD